MFMFCDYDDFDNVNVVALVMQIIFEANDDNKNNNTMLD